MSLLVSLVIPLALAVAAGLAIEAAADPGLGHRFGRRLPDLAIRLGSYALIAAFWFEFSWRPWLAAATTALTVLTTVLVDRLKGKVLGESLVFSDVALLGQVPQHPELYYTTPLTHPRMAGPILLGLGGVALWYVVEPAALPRGTLAAVCAVLGLPLALAALVLAARMPLGRRVIAARFPEPDLEADVARYGVLATMMAYLLRWGDERQRFRAGGAPAMPPPPRAGGDAVVVVVQLESFLDPERLGGPSLPLMARIRAGAAQYGRLAVPAHGAYTMRSEHAVLTGCEGASLGFGRFDPYLARDGRDPTSLARLAQAAGYRTVFVHPYHPDFFRRAAVMRAFGFEHLVMQEAFADAPRIGPYVSDEAVAERILAEVRAQAGPVLVFCVTMENHGPWRAGRLPGLDDPLAQYLHHVADSGRAMERLIDGLRDDGRGATLCLFGDHPPSLPGYRPGDGDRTTDYALFRFPAAETEPEGSRRVDLSVAALGRRLRDAVGVETAPLPPARDRPPRS